MMRIGQGFDAHAFAPDRPLILGGIKIEHHLGLAGHSDADVLIHAITDALLGAASLGDIGEHFPPSNPEYLNLDSQKILEFTANLLTKNHFVIQNLDCILICESPKISPWKGIIRKNLAQILNLEEDQISLKGKTTEGMGFTGRREGIASLCVALVESQSK